jgi:CheY-like chemotaxis protein
MSVSILVVDDEPDVADLFRQCFRREARNGTYVMHFANSGKEALDKLATGIEPQLIVILSDINMPVMNGLELLREIKTRRPDLPVMMVTAYGDDERRRLAGKYGPSFCGLLPGSRSLGTALQACPGDLGKGARPGPSRACPEPEQSVRGLPGPRPIRRGRATPEARRSDQVFRAKGRVWLSGPPFAGGGKGMRTPARRLG